MSARFIEYFKQAEEDIKCEVCGVFYLFCNEFHKFNNTKAQMLDSIYRHNIKITLKYPFFRKTL